jgi:hypothetical protein
MPFTVKESDKSLYQDLGHWAEVYEGLIAPAVEEVGLRPERDDQDTGSRFIGENILRKIEDADLILCDLSSHNPNVFLELGWALRADRPFVLIKDDLTNYTFDLNQQYTFDYSHSLQPTKLRKEVKLLADVLRLTLNDSSQRYSVLRRMSISLATIKPFAGDAQTEILLDIQRQLHRESPARKDEMSVAIKEEFPWPQLLRRGMDILFKTTELLRSQTSEMRSELVSTLDRASKQFTVQHDPEMQISLIDEELGVYLYHDWDELIGNVTRHAGTDGYDMYDEIRKYPHGAVAWIDRTSNMPRITGLRFNVALFATIGNWKLIVECHQEMDPPRFRF